MTGIKRVPDVLETFKRLLALGVDAQLVLVGDGPERDRLEQQAHELGIQKRTLFAGYQREISEYYDLFDAFLLPSRNEGTPVVAIESLAARTPVVATRVGGVPDVVRDGIDGFLTDVGDVDALAERLAELARDPGLRARMATPAASMRSRAIGSRGLSTMSTSCIASYSRRPVCSKLRRPGVRHDLRLSVSSLSPSSPRWRSAGPRDRGPSS
jgi:glycosyltransferase involved in cell wall biosynthesis